MQHLFLWGSGGTGKTLLLIEVLRMKLAYFKLKNIPTKVLVIVYHWGADENLELIKNLKEKFSDPSFDDYEIEPKTFWQICKGTVVAFLFVNILAFQFDHRAWN